MPIAPSVFADSADIPTEVLDDIYATEIAPAYLADIPPAEDKRAVLVGGQPGAGKSSVKDSLSTEIEDGYVAIDADELREYVPGYIDRARSVDQASQAASWSHAATQYLTGRLLEDAISSEANFIYDSTLAKADKAVDLINRLTDKGYQVNVAYVCTHRSISERGVQQRYFFDKRDVGLAADEGDLIPRYVPKEVQSEAVEGLATAVDSLDRHSHKTTGVHLSLWERNTEPGEPAQQLSFTPGKASQVLKKAHEHQLSNFEQLQEHFQKWNKLTAMITSPSSRATLDELWETSHVYSTQLERHEWEIIDRFKPIVADLLAADRTLSAQGDAYRNGLGEDMMQMIRETLSARLYDHIGETPE